MAANSAIEWTDTTWNPIVGCSITSPGCHKCYAQTMAKRLRAMALADVAAGRNPGRKRHYIDAVDDKGRWTGKLIPVTEALADPLGWKTPQKVFVNSMSDLFHEDVPDRFIESVFHVMARCHQHTFQVLTKRAERLPEWFKTLDGVGLGLDGKARERGKIMMGMVEYDWPLPNVWLGVSVERQQEADERIPLLLQTPAAVRFLSVEPLLGPVNLGPWFDPTGQSCCGGDETCYGNGRCPLTQWPRRDDGRFVGPDWVIVGGESGPNSRPCDVGWIRSIVEQCRAAAVPCFVKQVGSKPYECGGAADEIRSWGEAMIQTNGEFVQIHLKDRKGGDLKEWPADLRVRDFPAETR